MAHYAVRESPPLRGEIPISTSKNAVLPIMCGALLTGEDVRIERVPELTDVKTLCALLASCGCSVKKEGDTLVLNAGALQNPQDEEDVRKMRASVLVLGPLLPAWGGADSAARRMRHRPAADRSAPQGHERARREGRNLTTAA